MTHARRSEAGRRRIGRAKAGWRNAIKVDRLALDQRVAAITAARAAATVSGNGKAATARGATPWTNSRGHHHAPSPPPASRPVFVPVFDLEADRDAPRVPARDVWADE